MKLVIVIASCFLLLACEYQEIPSNTSLEISPLCEFRASDCLKKTTNNEVEVVLHLSQPDAPSEVPFRFDLTTSQLVENVTMRLEGRDMFMGVIPVKLTPIDDTSFSGELLYGSCSSGYMVWNAIVTFDYLGKSHQLVFAILADNPI
ncbi:hypothetical protein [uncultured Shewanella sp.]|uniref:hypothetical protein n=1 Tax=uncultured Shewanella sp. TaxID=173975 RepID=UPI0026127D6E|nr:hypothetical protein [uncultured Shewanella sp.]